MKQPFEKVVVQHGGTVLHVCRVLRADGTPGGYVGGPAAKMTLLSLEASVRHVRQRSL